MIHVYRSKAVVTRLELESLEESSEWMADDAMWVLVCHPQTHAGRRMWHASAVLGWLTRARFR
jgi:hypothetical protein